MTVGDRWVLGSYGAWTTLVLMASFAHDGMSANTVTRLLILAYLALTAAFWWKRPAPAPGRAAFILHCCRNAMAVEFCYMFSRPVFESLVYKPGMSLAQLLQNTLIDWCFTFPAYGLIFSVFWWILQRFRYSLAEYVLLFSAGQALGDGNAFFMANPGMLLFIPYVMLNYQAIQVIPYLHARPALHPHRRRGRWLAPLLLIPLTYWVAGALIIGVGRFFQL